MAYRILAVQSDGTPPEASVPAALAAYPQFAVQRVSWDRGLAAPAGEQRPHAVVAVAVPGTVEVTRAFETMRAAPPSIPTLIVLPPQPEVPLLQLGAQIGDDFLLAPIRGPELHQRLKRILGAVRDDAADVQTRLLDELALTQLVGRDPAFLAAVRQLPRLARFDAPVLISGETGTGKELSARAIHFLGARRDQPFIAVDCGAIPDTLLENELFGHVRGAYTDAHRGQRGLVAMADGGTLFLDEIDALSLSAQRKMLRFLQERTFRPLGADRFEVANVNIIAATNGDLEAAVSHDRFRADLLYRLNVLTLRLPPLRERRDDIRVLAEHFLRDVRHAHPVSARSYSAAALRLLMQHDWPGNVRQLANVVQRAVVACEGSQVLPQHLALTVPGACADGERRTGFRAARAEMIGDFERRYVEELLERHHGNVTRAAREAQKDRRAFGRLVKKHGIDRTVF